MDSELLIKKTVCELNKCSGCMACMDVCPRKSISIVDSISSYNAIINDSCVNCGSCHRVCQQNNIPILKSPKYWYQGWAKDEGIRANSSSGGFATSIALSFIKMGGSVVCCCFSNGNFGFKSITSEEELTKCKGSKYVKSNPIGSYRKTKELLISGNKVLYIGLPCQVASMQNFIGENLKQNLYTIDLICHGTPSPRFLEMFFEQYNYSLQNVKDVVFRTKSQSKYGDSYKRIALKSSIDKYTLAFQKGLTFTENCFSCKYAKKERVSDITLGDSWGSELSDEEKEKGISLALSQTDKGNELLNLSNLVLLPVDLEKAIANNHQLEHPFKKPKNRKKFLNNIENNETFNKVIFDLYPKICIKASIKGVITKIKLNKLAKIKDNPFSILVNSKR